ERLKALFLERSVHEREAVASQAFVQDNAADGGIDQTVDVLAYVCPDDVLSVVLGRQVDKVALPAKPDLCLGLNDSGIESEQHVIDGAERLAVALHLVAAERQVIAPEYNIL